MKSDKINIIISGITDIPLYSNSLHDSRDKSSGEFARSKIHALPNFDKKLSDIRNIFRRL